MELQFNLIQAINVYNVKVQNVWINKYHTRDIKTKDKGRKSKVESRKSKVKSRKLKVKS
jgi:hypothetical protein